MLTLPLLGTDPATAQEEDASPEHGKINTPDATPVDPGSFEVETVYSHASGNRAWDNREIGSSRGYLSEHAAGLSITAGIVNNFDIAIGSGYNWLRDEDNDYDGDGNPNPTTGNGLGDLDLHARYRFIRDDAQSLDVAYIGGVTIPTGDRNGESRLGGSQEFWSLNQTLVASKDWGKGTANLAAGFALPFGDRKGAARGTFYADLGIGYQILPWLQPEAEVNFARDFVSQADDAETLAVTGGLVMPVNDRLRINAGVQQAVWGRNADKTTVYSLAVKAAF